MQQRCQIFFKSIECSVILNLNLKCLRGWSSIILFDDHIFNWNFASFEMKFADFYVSLKRKTFLLNWFFAQTNISALISDPVQPALITRCVRIKQQVEMHQVFKASVLSPNKIYSMLNWYFHQLAISSCQVLIDQRNKLTTLINLRHVDLIATKNLWNRYRSTVCFIDGKILTVHVRKKRI